MEQLKGLLILYSALLLFNALFCAMLWLKTPNRIYRSLCLAWVSLTICFVLQGLVATSPYIYRICVGATGGFGTSLFFADILAQVAGVPLSGKRFFILFVLGLCATVLANCGGAPLFVMGEPAVLAGALPIFVVAYRAASRRVSAMTFVSGSFLVSAVLWALHLLDFPYALDKPQWMFPGFTLATVFAIGLSIFSIASVLEQSVAESARIQAESKYRATLANSAKMASLGEMAGGIAHEINSPLAAIKVLASQIQEVLGDEPLDRAIPREMAADIEKTSGRIAKIVLGLRTFSRDGSRDPVEIVGVIQLIEDTLALCNERFKSFGIDVEVEGLGKDLSFEGRATQISQVLINLLNNAFDAVANLKEKWIKLSFFEGSDWFEIRVTDSGGGIPEEIRAKIFQPFFTTKDVGKGTGMGLSISHGIVQSHRGELKVDSTSPHTRLVVRLPRKQGTAHNNPQSTSS